VGVNQSQSTSHRDEGAPPPLAAVHTGFPGLTFPLSNSCPIHPKGPGFWNNQGKGTAHFEGGKIETQEGKVTYWQLYKN
jgi:hypothetical protein